MKSKLIIFLIIFFHISSCTNIMFANEEGYHAYLNGFIGKPISEYIKVHGQADSTSESATGNKVFVFKDSRHESTPVSCTKDKKGNTNCSGGTSSDYSCTTYIEVNNEKVIVGSSFKGNDCNRCPPVTQKTCIGKK